MADTKDGASRRYKKRRWATPRRKEIAIGQRFGRWTVVGTAPPRPGSLHVYWRCRCDCGTERDQKGTVLLCGRTSSCGCLARDMAKQRAKHGMSDSDLYKIWRNMRSRCENPTDKNYKNYGERGISVCSRWQDFSLFYQDVGPRPSRRHSLGRIDNDGDYEPGNTRWELPLEQANNRRTNRTVSYNGKTLTVAQWAKELGIPSHRLFERINRGVPMDVAMTSGVLPKRVPKGEIHSCAKLTNDQVREIFLSRKSHRLCALEYGVSITTVAQIRRRERWRGVTDDILRGPNGQSV